MHRRRKRREEMEDERCEMEFENLVDEQNLEKNQCSMSSNSQENNNNTNNNDQKQEFLSITPNIIHHFSTNNHEQVDQFLQISTPPPTTSSSSATTNTPNNNNIPSHFLSSATTIPPPLAAAVAKNNNQNFYAKGCRKSSSNNNNTSTSTSTGNNNNINSNSNSNNNKEQDRFLPIANVGRIMKKYIPGNGKISKDAKETVQECVSEFISFVTGEASDKCQREKRKTINGDDIIWAITTLGFEDYVVPLKQYLNKYRELEGEKLNVPKQQQRNHNNDHHQHQHLHHHQKPNIPNYHCHNNVYSSSTSMPSFVPNDQPFPLPFSQAPNIQTRLPQHEHIDSVGNW